MGNRTQKVGDIIRRILVGRNGLLFWRSNYPWKQIHETFKTVWMCLRVLSIPTFLKGGTLAVEGGGRQPHPERKRKFLQFYKIFTKMEIIWKMVQNHLLLHCHSEISSDLSKPNGKSKSVINDYLPWKSSNNEIMAVPRGSSQKILKIGIFK